MRASLETYLFHHAIRISTASDEKRLLTQYTLYLCLTSQDNRAKKRENEKEHDGW
jgi:hypothetical protein